MAKPYITTKIRYKSEEWYEAHKKGLGGSDAAAICRMSQYASPLTVYFDKLGLSPEREENEAMKQGSELEEYGARRFVEKTGKKVRIQPFMLQSKKYPFMLADVDRFVVGEDAILEIKTTLNRDGYTFEGNDYPATYMVQALHYMAVTGAKKAYIAVLVFGRDFKIIPIERNETVEKDIQALIQLEKQFWEENVAKEIPPIPTGIENDSKFLSTAYQANEELQTVDLTPLDKQLEEIIALKAQKSLLESEIAKRENSVKTTLAEATRGETERYKVTWKESTSNKFDSTAFKRDNPEVYNQYCKLTTSRRFLLSEKK